MRRAGNPSTVGRLVGAGVAVALACGLLASAAPAESLGPFWWQSPAQVGPPTQQPFNNRISCPSTSLCVATVAGSDVATSIDPAGGAPAWRLDHVDSNTAQSSSGTYVAFLTDVSCPSTTLCVAVDNLGNVLASTDPTAGSPWSSANITSSAELWALSCASESLCVAGAGHGRAVISANPAAGAGAWRTVAVDTPDSALVYATSCPSTALCVAGDLTGHLLTSTDPAADPGPWRTVFADSNGAICNICTFEPTPIQSIACPSTALCLASDGSGYVLTSTEPTGSSWRLTNVSADTRSIIESLACPATSRCLGVSYDRVYVKDDPARGGPWSSTSIDPGSRGLTGISCPSPALCVAVDSEGRIIVGHAGPTRARMSALVRAQLMPRGSAARIAAVLRHGGYALRFAAPIPGRLGVGWIHPSGGGRAHPPVLVTFGTYTFATPGSALIRLALTNAGRAILKRHGHLRLVARATFTPSGGTPIAATRTIRLHR